MNLNDLSRRGGGWVGFDLDGTLAEYHGFHGGSGIGAPIKPVVDELKKLLARGIQVRIFTARVSGEKPGEAMKEIEAWLKEHVGEVLPITCVKDYSCIAIVDDRAISAEKNTGRMVSFIDGKAVVR